MREPVRIFGHDNLRRSHLSGLSIAAPGSGVHKDDGIAARKIFGQFRSKLMYAEKFHLRPRERYFQAVGSMPRNPIIAAHRISISDNQNARHGSFFREMVPSLWGLSAIELPVPPATWLDVFLPPLSRKDI